MGEPLKVAPVKSGPVRASDPPKGGKEKDKKDESHSCDGWAHSLQGIGLEGVVRKR